MWDKPLQGDVDIVFLLARDRVAADLPILDGVQVHLLNQTILIQSIGKIALVAQHQDRDANQLGLLQQVVQLVSRCLNLVQVRSVDHVDNGIDSSTVSLPHGPESGLSANVPQFDGDVPLCNFSHVKADGGNHVFVELTRRNDVDERRFARVLKTNLKFNLKTSCLVAVASE